MMTPAELAAYYKVSEKTIARMTADGMPSRLIGARRRYDLAEVEAWTKERACRPGKPLAICSTRKPASSGSAYTDFCRKVRVRVMPSD